MPLHAHRRMVIDGKLIEKPVLRDMHRIVAIADRMGL
jgi:(S)-citramalyl-CoA lyase